MRKVVDEEGNEIEVPTEEELVAIKVEGEKKVAEAQALFEKEKKELEAQVNPNWKAMRDANEKLKEAVKASGKEIDEQGNIIEKPVGFNKEEIIKTSEEAARKVYLDGQIATQLNKYDNETAKIIKHYFTKLSAGEEITMENVNSFIQQAEATAGLNVVERKDFGRGGVPNFNKEIPSSSKEMGRFLGNNEEDFKKDSIIDLTK